MNNFNLDNDCPGYPEDHWEQDCAAEEQTAEERSHEMTNWQPKPKVLNQKTNRHCVVCELNNKCVWQDLGHAGDMCIERDV